LLDREFQDIKFEYVYPYQDDVIYSDNFDQHIQHIRKVFNRLRGAGLTINPDKVVFATQEISFLVHIVSSSGLRVDPERRGLLEIFCLLRM
jgi:hypothetical protein